jgi:hypothetical protein
MCRLAAVVVVSACVQVFDGHLILYPLHVVCLELGVYREYLYVHTYMVISVN